MGFVHRFRDDKRLILMDQPSCAGWFAMRLSWWRLGRNHLHTLQVLCGSYNSSQLRPLWHQQHHRGLFAHNDICILCLVLWIDPNCIVPDCSMNLAAGPATKLPDTDSPDLASQSTGKDHDHRLSRSICFERERRGTVWSISGWWWLEPWIFLTFHILGMSWSQLTFIFFRGVDIPPSRFWLEQKTGPHLHEDCGLELVFSLRPRRTCAMTVRNEEYTSIYYING